MVTIRRDRTEPHADAHTGPSDRQLRATIVSRLRENPYTQDGHIKVTVHDGIVHLSGEVPTTIARDVAVEDIEGLPGVADVELGLHIAA